MSKICKPSGVCLCGGGGLRHCGAIGAAREEEARPRAQAACERHRGGLRPRLPPRRSARRAPRLRRPPGPRQEDLPPPSRAPPLRGRPLRLEGAPPPGALLRLRPPRLRRNLRLRLRLGVDDGLRHRAATTRQPLQHNLRQHAPRRKRGKIVVSQEPTSRFWFLVGEAHQIPERCRRPPWQRTQPSRADLRPIFRLGPRRIECPQAPELLDEEMVLPMLPTTLKGMVVQPALLRSGRCRGEQRLRHQVPVAEVPRGELRHLKMEQQIVHESHSSTAPAELRHAEAVAT